jgi:predicted acylesterase/phospholipase RssA
VDTIGNPSVITNFIRKERDFRKGKSSPYVCVIFVPAGGMACAESAARLKCIAEETPYAPDVCAGISGGAANLYGFLLGKMDLALKIYEHLASMDFISVKVSIRRFRILIRLRMRINYLVNILRNGFDGEEINQQVAHDHPSRFIVYATEYNKGKSVAIDAKETEPDMVEAVRASSMIAGICSGEVHIGGERLADGGHSMPFPIRDIVKTHRPTDILVLLNRPLPEKMGWLEWLFFPVTSRLLLWWHDVSPKIRDYTAAMDRTMALEMRLLQRNRRGSWKLFWKKLKRGIWSWKDLFFMTYSQDRPKVNWFVVAPKRGEAIPQMTRDIELIRRATDRSYNEMKELFEKYAPEEDAIQENIAENSRAE